MYCSNCKAKMNEGDYVCKNCGMKKITITKQEVKDLSYLSKCSICGKELSSTAEVCPNCGQKTENGIKKDKEKEKTMISIITAVLTVVAAILVVSSMPITRNSEGTFFMGIILFATSIGIDIGMFIRNKKEKE